MRDSATGKMLVGDDKMLVGEGLGPLVRYWCVIIGNLLYGN